MHKIMLLIITFVLLTNFFISYTIFADNDIKVVIDGVVQSYDQMPVLVNNRTLVPLRGIFESLGATVSWYEDTETIIGIRGTKSIVLQLGNSFATVNNEGVILDVVPQTMNDRTMVPVRFVSESLGALVSCDDSTQTVIITSPEYDND